MRAIHIVIFAVLTAIFFRLEAQDLNGYINPYECKAGGTWCDIDIDAYAACACDNTFNDTDTLNAIETALNSADDCHCFNPGDYSFLTGVVVTANGTANAKKVMRLVGAGTTNPANLPTNQQAIIQNIEVQGDHWIIHRLTFQRNRFDCLILDNADGTLVNNILHENAEYRQQNDCDNCGIQNSVLRETDPPPGNDVHCAKFRNGTDQFFLNNEAYNCTDHLQVQDFGGAQTDFVPGIKIINNDMYITSDLYCDDDGTPNVNGFYSQAENYLDFKAGASQANPGLIYKNRMWGMKKTDPSCGSSGSDGSAISIQQPHWPEFEDDNHYLIIQNNIIHGARNFIGFDDAPGDHHSIIGNWIHRQVFEGPLELRIFRMTASENIEVYLNTIIDPLAAQGEGRYWLRHGGDDQDFRCNVLINAGDIAGTKPTGAQFNHNVYYGTEDAGDANKIDKTLVERANSTAYVLNQAMVTDLDSTQCSSTSDEDCFMYIATVAGTSAAGAPTYCTTPNCTFADGTVTWKAIRGPKVYYRFPNEIYSPAQLAYVPYGIPYSSAPEYLFCPPTFADRLDMGADDTTP